MDNLIQTPKRKITIRYPGNVNDHELLTPHTGAKAIKVCKDVIATQKKKINQLRMANKRLNEKISSMDNLFVELRNAGHLTQTACESLEVIIIQFLSYILNSFLFII